MFNLVDPCVAVQWSVVDYWRKPKGSYDALRRAFSPQYLFTLLDRDRYRVGQTVKIPIYAVNDAHRAYAQVRAAAEVRDEGGSPLLRREWALSLPADSRALEVGRLALPVPRAGRYTVRLELDWGEGTLENVYEVVVE
jgi:beta-mannosidase